MNILAMIPPHVRLGIYVVYGVGSLVVTYLVARGTWGGDELALWTGIGSLLGLTAASNVDRTKHRRKVHRRADR